MKNVYTKIIVIFSVQLLFASVSLGQFTPCTASDLCSPDNPGDLSPIEVQKTYTCSLTSNIPKTPQGFETVIKSKDVVTSGKASFLTYTMQTEDVEVTILTNFSSISLLELKDRVSGVSALVEDGTPFGSSNITQVNLINYKKEIQYRVYCYLPLASVMQNNHL